MVILSILIILSILAFSFVVIHWNVFNLIILAIWHILVAWLLIFFIWAICVLFFNWMVILFICTIPCDIFFNWVVILFSWASRFVWAIPWDISFNWVVIWFFWTFTFESFWFNGTFCFLITECLIDWNLVVSMLRLLRRLNPSLHSSPNVLLVHVYLYKLSNFLALLYPKIA